MVKTLEMAVLVANGADHDEVEAKRSQQQEDKTPRGCSFLSLASCGLFLVCVVLYFWNAEIAGEEVKGTVLIDSPLASSRPVVDPQNRRLASLPQTVVIKEKKADPKNYAVHPQVTNSSKSKNAIALNQSLKPSNPKKFLLYFTHSGLSNQFIGLERASFLAQATGRILVVPPVLPHTTSTKEKM